MKFSFITLILVSLLGLSSCGDGGEGGNNPVDPVDPAAPVLSDIPQQFVLNQPGSSLSVTVTATDPNGLQLFYDYSVEPVNTDTAGIAFNNDTGEFAWNTEGVAAGDYVFTFTVTNTAGLVDTGVMTVTVKTEWVVGEAGPGGDIYTHGDAAEDYVVDLLDDSSGVFDAYVVKAYTVDGNGSYIVIKENGGSYYALDISYYSSLTNAYVYFYDTYHSNAMTVYPIGDGTYSDYYYNFVF